MTDLEVLRAKFFSIYANVPQNLRKDIIVVVDKESYSWQTALFEIKEKTNLGNKILKALKNLKII